MPSDIRLGRTDQVRNLRSVMENKDLRPVGGVGVYIVKDGKLLLSLRTSSHSPDTWCPPGGHIEYGETFLDTAKRETKEETGMDIDEIEIMGVTSDVYEDEKKHVISVHIKAKLFSGEPKIMEPDKFSEIKWFDLADLPENLFPANKHFFSLNLLCLCDSGKKFNDCHGE
jgi:8-oxo-dGTP diphosphatase